MEKFVVESYSDMRNISGLSLSPDGKHAVYCVDNINFEKDGSDFRLWLIDTDTGKETKLTDGPADFMPFWIDNETVGFSSARAVKDALPGHTNFFKVRIDGSEPECYISVPARGAGIKKVPTGGWLVSATTDLNAEGEGNKKNWTVYNEYPHHINGMGYVNQLRKSIHFWDPATGEFRRLTDPYTQISGLNVIFDEEGFYYVGKTYEKVYAPADHLYKHIWATGENRAVYTDPGYSVSEMHLLNGRIYMYLRSTVSGPLLNSGLVASINVDGNDFVVESVPEFMVAGSKLIGDSIWFVKQEKAHHYLARWTPGTKDETIDTGNVFTDIICSAGGVMLILGREGEKMREIFRCENGSIRRLSHQNDELYKKYSFSEHEYVSVMDNGYEIEGWVLKPVNMEKGKKYPGILLIHGGPYAYYTNDFSNDRQCFANEGYFVFFCNPRGSVSYGVDFMNITGASGTYDYENIMAFTDAVIARFPELDAERLAVTGGSYGGFMTNWIIGHTDRFKAAVPKVSISNWISWHGCSDNKWMGDARNTCTPWSDLEKLWFHSPLKYADNIKTPTLLIQHDQDHRCPVEQAEQMFTALVERGVPAKMVVNHGVSHMTRKPSQIENDMKLMLEWFEKYM